MKKLIESVSYALDDRYIMEMANLQPHETGLMSIIHISSKGGAKHGPRVKVSNIAGTFHYKDNFSITLENKPRVIGTCKLNTIHLHDIIDWINLNKAHLIKVWNQGDIMTSREIENGFKKL